MIFPDSFGTLDELIEALTLIQTQKIRHFPVIPLGDTRWSGLLERMHAELAGLAFIAEDLALLHLTDRPVEVCAIVDAACDRQRDFYRVRGR